MPLYQLAFAAFCVVVGVVGGVVALSKVYAQWKQSRAYGWRDYRVEEFMETLVHLAGGLMLILLGVALLSLVLEKLL